MVLGGHDDHPGRKEHQHRHRGVGEDPHHLRQLERRHDGRCDQADESHDYAAPAETADHALLQSHDRHEQRRPAGQVDHPLDGDELDVPLEQDRSLGEHDEQQQAHRPGNRPGQQAFVELGRDQEQAGEHGQDSGHVHAQHPPASVQRDRKAVVPVVAGEEHPHREKSQQKCPLSIARVGFGRGLVSKVHHKILSILYEAL